MYPSAVENIKRNRILSFATCALFSVLPFSGHSQSVIKTYTYNEVPELPAFIPPALPPIATVFTGLDAYALPWFSGAPTVTDVYPLFGYIDIAAVPGVSEQVVHERVVNFCGQTNVQFKIRSGFDQDVSYLFISPTSNPEHAVYVVGCASGDDESDPTTPPINPVGGIFVRGYLSDDSVNCSFYVDWYSDQQPFWKPLTNGEFVAINTYGASVMDSVVCLGDSTTVILADSDIGTSYALRNDFNDSIIDGPIQGTGAPLPFNTGPVDSTTSYNVLCLGPNDALNFDGVDDHVLAPNNPDLELNDGSIDVFLRPFSTASNQTILAFQNPTETLTRYSFNFLPGLAGIQFDNGSTVETIFHSFTAEEWQEISFVDNSVNTEAFVNGVSIGSFTTEFGSASGPDMVLYIGGNGAGTEMFSGDMEEVRIWNLIKSGSDFVNESDSCMWGSEGGLVALYKFEDGYGSTVVKDVSTVMNDGAMVNMDEFTDWVASKPETCSSCDVQMFETVTVYNPYFETTAEICEDDSIFVGGDWQSTSGIYYDTLVSIELGCDSVIETTLTAHPEYYNVLAPIGICDDDSIMIFGTWQSTSGVYYDSLNTINGCDSVLEQQLSIDPTYFTVLPDEYICPLDSTEVFGSFYVYTPGIYYDTLPTTAAGCDSVLQVEVMPAETPPVGILAYNLSVVCVGGGPVTVPLGSPAGGTYSGAGVSGTIFDPSGLTPGLYYTTYTWTSAHGCTNADSAFVYVEDCLGIGTLGEGQQISLFPNPNNGNFSLQFAYVDEPLNVAIYNSLGAMVYGMQVTEALESVELPAPAPGVYLMMISSEVGVAYRQFVVE